MRDLYVCKSHVWAKFPVDRLNFDFLGFQLPVSHQTNPTMCISRIVIALESVIWMRHAVNPCTRHGFIALRHNSFIIISFVNTVPSKRFCEIERRRIDLWLFDLLTDCICAFKRFAEPAFICYIFLVLIGIPDWFRWYPTTAKGQVHGKVSFDGFQGQVILVDPLCCRWNRKHFPILSNESSNALTSTFDGIECP